MPEGPPQHQIDRSHARQHARPIVSQTLAEMAPWLIIAVPLSLTVYIGYLRKKLGDDPRRPQMIETVREAGYRYLPPKEGG